MKLLLQQRVLGSWTCAQLTLQINCRKVVESLTISTGKERLAQLCCPLSIHGPPLYE